MYALVNGTKYKCSKPKQSDPFGTWFSINMLEEVEVENPITENIGIYSDDDFELCIIDVSMYKRQELESSVWLFTNNDKVEPIIIEPTPPSIEEVRTSKINEMSQACNEIIINGIDIEDAHYSMSLEDQLNILTLQGMILNGQASVPYHADGESCVMYSAEDFLEIANAATNHKLYHESYFNSMRDWINALEDTDAIEYIYYGIEIPVEYQTDVLKGLIQSLGITYTEPENTEVVEEGTTKE